MTSTADLQSRDPDKSYKKPGLAYRLELGRGVRPGLVGACVV